MFKYPYSNLHELNLDWIIQEVKELRTVVESANIPDRAREIVRKIIDANNNIIYTESANETGIIIYAGETDTKLAEYNYSTNSITIYSENGKNGFVKAHTLNATSKIIMGDSASDSNMEIIFKPSRDIELNKIIANRDSGVITIAAKHISSQAFEYYNLPVPDQGRTSSIAYNILTSKNLAVGFDSNYFNVSSYVNTEHFQVVGFARIHYIYYGGVGVAFNEQYKYSIKIMDVQVTARTSGLLQLFQPSLFHSNPTMNKIVPNVAGSYPVVAINTGTAATSTALLSLGIGGSFTTMGYCTEGFTYRINAIYF